MDLDAKIEGILFWKGESMNKKKLMQILNVQELDFDNALNILKEKLSNRGITLIINENEITLGTNKELSSIIESLTKEELSKDLGKAGLETLSVILYQSPVSRAEIDYIRGVNSQFILRNLLVRGLIERIDNPKDQRSFLYKPTLQLLTFMGLSKTEDLPDFEKVKKDIDNFKQNKIEDEQKS